MCGIAGILSENIGTNFEIVTGMVQSIRHRGPNGQNVRQFSQACLGHARLSIIDLQNGTQPMSTLSDDVAITFNGEIYNYKEIKEQSSYDFKTSSDTEVLLALYLEQGTNFVPKLLGMFAFAIWDRRSNSIFCARDRFGEKPFFYALGKNNEFIFSSEIKAIISTGLVDCSLDEESLSHYLQRLYVPSDRTIYKNIHVLRPGHQLLASSGKITVKKYWTIPSLQDISFETATLQLKSLLKQAVERQMISDVEIGAFLSGGLDSSTIVSFMSQKSKGFKTFSFGLTGEKNELSFAKEVSQLYGTNHFELTEDGSGIADLILKMGNIYDEPFADSSNIPTYLISSFASRYVKVVLSGDGADELLGGYSFWYKPLSHITESYSDLSYFGVRLLGLINRVTLKNKKFKNVVDGKSLHRKFGTIAESRINQNHYFSNEEIESLGIKPFHKKVEIPVSHTLNDALFIDTLDYLPGDILTKTDRASMANGLEIRSPFLDPNLAEFCLSLPASFKVDSNIDKKLLRASCSHLWPESIRNRRKQGFGADVKSWLNKSDVQLLIKEYLLNPNKKMFKKLNFDVVQSYALGSQNYQTWALLNLSIWFELHESR